MLKKAMKISHPWAILKFCRHSSMDYRAYHESQTNTGLCGHYSPFLSQHFIHFCFILDNLKSGNSYRYQAVLCTPLHNVRNSSIFIFFKKWCTKILMKRQTIIPIFAYKHIIEHFLDFYTLKVSYRPDFFF